METRKKRLRKKRSTVGTPHEEAPAKALLGDFALGDVHDYRIDRAQFIAYLHTRDVDPEDAEHVSESGINPTMANEFARSLSVLSGINPERPILVDMSTCGGDWESGMQIFSSILACPNPITVLARRWARSMSSIVPLAADKFVLDATARFMYHFGLEQEANAEDSERRMASERMLLLYVARLKEQGAYKKWGEQKILRLLEDKLRDKINVWLGPREAVRFGFADEVFSGNWETLRTHKRNEKRRQRMLAVLNEDIKIDLQIHSRLRTKL